MDTSKPIDAPGGSGAQPSPDGGGDPPRIAGKRLELIPLGPAALLGLLRGDRTAVEAEAGVRIPGEPMAPPPLIGEHLDHYALSREVEGVPTWWVWVAADRGRGEAVGMLAAPAAPDAWGRVAVGYTLWPEMQGSGYATEALRLFADWAVGRADVAAVRVTVEPGNRPSLRVAHRAGLRAVGVREDDRHGSLIVFERTAGAQLPAG